MDYTIIEEALQLYRKVCAKEQIKKGFKDRYDEYKDINKDFALIQFTLPPSHHPI